MENLKSLRVPVTALGIISWAGIFCIEQVSDIPRWFFFLTFLVHAATIFLFYVATQTRQTQETQTEISDIHPETQK